MKDITEIRERRVTPEPDSQADIEATVRAIKKTQGYLLSCQNPEGYWKGELEADASVSRTAFSSLLRDAHDYTCMFTDSRGQELVQGTFCTPGQAGAMALGVKTIINSMPLEE